MRRAGGSGNDERRLGLWRSVADEFLRPGAGAGAQSRRAGQPPISPSDSRHCRGPSAGGIPPASRCLATAHTMVFQFLIPSIVIKSTCSSVLNSARCLFTMESASRTRGPYTLASKALSICNELTLCLPLALRCSSTTCLASSFIFSHCGVAERICPMAIFRLFRTMQFPRLSDSVVDILDTDPAVLSIRRTSIQPAPQPGPCRSQLQECSSFLIA